jgi:hypothetical protein
MYALLVQKNLLLQALLLVSQQQCSAVHCLCALLSSIVSGRAVVAANSSYYSNSADTLETDSSATLVYVRAGIGPKDDEFSNKKFSFVRYQSICAVIPDSSDFEAKARAAGDEALAIERGGMKQ